MRALLECPRSLPLTPTPALLHVKEQQSVPELAEIINELHEVDIYCIAIVKIQVF